MKQLITALSSAKKAEEKAKAKRIKAEEALIEALGKRDEGSKSYTVDDWTVTITAKLNRSIDWDKWDQVSGTVPKNLHPVKTKRELDVKGVKWLKDHDAKNYKLLVPCLTSKPGKTAVTIKQKGK